MAPMLRTSPEYRPFNTVESFAPKGLPSNEYTGQGLSGEKVPSSTASPNAKQSIQHEIENIEWPHHTMLDRMVESAWAILLSRYSESEETVFHAVLEAPIDASPVAPSAVRISVTEERTLNELQHQLMLADQAAAPARGPTEEVDMSWQARSLLIMTEGTATDKENTLDTPTYSLALQCEVKETSLQLNMAFDTTVITQQEASRVIHLFQHILRQLCTANMVTTKVSDLDTMSEQDLQQVWTWNATVPEEIGGCVHDILAASVARYPHKTAISAWDGELSYTQWDRIAMQLANHLIHNGVRPGDVLPLIFEKSMWVPVCQYAVMKAGAASVVIDPSQTKERIKTIIDIVGPGLILCGVSTAALVAEITYRKPFITTNETVSEVPVQSDDGSFTAAMPEVKGSDLLYVVFTSGTTGNPKGATVTHSNFTSAIQHQNEYLNFKPTARVAGFCSYAFDVSWSDFIHTLAAGACFCIPSERDRKHDFIDYMNKNKVTFVHLTPSVAAILDLDNVPTLDTVALIGEVVDYDKLPQLRNVETTIVTYGPAECTVTTTAVINNGHSTKATIGWGLGSTAWVADPNKDALTPVGLIGELLLEGPLVGAGYLHNPEKTAAAFVEDPSWLLRGGGGVEGRNGRLYRTGDLVRYTTDGELIYLGRKDTQVKIHGQRTELGDVEHHVSRVLNQTPAVADVVAEVVTPQVTQRPMLVAFLLMPSIPAEELADRAASIIETLNTQLPELVPPHMVPSVYIPMSDLPRGLTGKMDRKALRAIGAKLDRQALAALHGDEAVQHVEPTTEEEKQLRDMWAAVLNIPVGDIGLENNFLRLGGDSIAAIRLATDLGRKGISLTVPDIFGKPQLRAMAKLMSQSTAPVKETVDPFQLLKDIINKEDACREAAELCSVDGDNVEAWQVEDIFPCTAIQEGLLALTARKPGKYVGHQIAEIKAGVCVEKLRAAWEQVAQKASVLRTRIVDLPGQGLVQVVLQEELKWQTLFSLGDYEKSKGDATVMGLGTPLSRVAVIDDKAAGKKYLALTQHHATYDGWSVPLLQKHVEEAYETGEASQSLLPLQAFVKHVMEQNGHEAATFWEQQFAEIEASPFPTLPAKTYEPKPDKVVSCSISNIRWPSCGVTPASTLRAAWATLVSWYVDSPDITFGAVVSGRQAPVAGIEAVAGPTIATVPVRIMVHGTVEELLHRVQGQAIDMLPFEQYGLQHISQVSQAAKYACDFQTLLLVHPAEEETEESAIFTRGFSDEEKGSVSENTYAMMLTCQISDAGLTMQLSFDSVVFEGAAAERLLQQLEHILAQMAAVDGATEVSALDRVSERDLLDVWQWNAVVPDTVNDCVHHIFAQRVTETPNRPAVCAWDGNLSYAELDQLSTLLAGRLLSANLGVGPGSIVPLCFEKSVWVPVAVMAVMKVGAASVALDTTLPQSRLQSIVGQLSATVMLTSKACAALAPSITDTPTIEVGGDREHLERFFQPIPAMPAVDPSSPLYIVFTSGSTGAPKGATVTHANFCSAIKYHQHELGLDSSSRVFDYTSYAFDVAWSNVLHTLTVGGCLCIPSEDERTADINGSISRMQANFIHMTPTVGRLLDPTALRCLKKVLFIGEALKASDVARWEASGAEIYNTYGPAECTVTSTVEIVKCKPKTSVGDPSIGHGVGALLWVVQPRAPEKLAAIGSVGELWLEGPIVGAGYLNNPEKTSAAFVEDPKWLLEGVAGQVAGRRGRLYKTGDLVYYNPDGTLGFVGRNDTQVKINGQRMELGEVEHHVRHLLSLNEVSQIVVDVITPNATQTPTLAVFLVVPDSDKTENGLKEAYEGMIERLKKDLSKLLPSYMVPSAYIPISISNLPMTATGKTDRREVRELGKAYSLLVPFAANDAEDDAIATKTEVTLRGIWAKLLGIQAEIIAAGHSFSEVGGDSIKTMSLAMAIRKEFDVNLGVPRLVRQNSLRELAALIDSLLGGQTTVEDPTEPSSTDIEKEIDALVRQMNLRKRVNRSTVFLTGSTGFLGTQILHYTLRNRAFNNVVLLVRALQGQQDGMHRVIQMAKIAGWWRDSFADAIEVWNGDLAADKLGLTEPQWNAVCGRPSEHGTIDAIIHNGAVVHWSTDYSNLKNVNVGSTMQLLQAAHSSPFVKNFVYVSGGLITDSLTWTEDEARMSNGYDQTKYVSERLVSAAATATHAGECGTTFSVVKPGQIIGDVYTGVANADDFLWRVVVGAMRLGARPMESPTSWLSVSDVRHVSESILWEAAGRSHYNFRHIKRGVLVTDFWAVVEDVLQTPLRAVCWETWTEMAKEDMDNEGETHPLWPVQQFFGQLGTEIEVTEREGCAWEVREVLAATRKNIEYLKVNGFFGGGEKGSGTVMTRTRNASVMKQVV